MNRYPSKTDIATFGVGGILIGAGVAVALMGPEVLMPVHYGANGQVDRFGGRIEVGVAIGVMGATALVLCGLLGLAVVRADAARARALRLAQLLSLTILTAVTLLIGGTALGQVESLGTILPMAATSAIMLITGAFLGRVPPNPIMGVRTPWSYKSRLAWDRSNRLAGRLMFIIGLVGLALAAFAPQPLGLFSVIGAVLIAALWSVIESWRVWRADPELQPF